MNLFETFGLSQELIDSIKRMGFKEPTEIQKEAIPPIMKGKDVIGESATGSGKTRIAVQLLHKLEKSGQLKRALFVCDRKRMIKSSAIFFAG